MFASNFQPKTLKNVVSLQATAKIVTDFDLKTKYLVPIACFLF